MQSITIHGNLGKDPEERFTSNSDRIADISVAVKGKDAKGKDVTTWYKAGLMGRQADTALQYLKKGSEVIVEGDLQVDEWVDRDNRNRYTLNIRFAKFKMCGGRKDSSNQSKSDDDSEYFGN